MKIFFKTILGIVILLALFFSKDFRASIFVLRNYHFKMVYLFLCLFTLTLSLFIQLLLWFYLLKQIDKKVNFFNASVPMLLSFIANYFSPISAGSPLKSMFLKKNTGINISRSIPLIAIEVISAVFAIFLIALIFYSISFFGGSLNIPIQFFSKTFISAIVIIIIGISFTSIILTKRALISKKILDGLPFKKFIEFIKKSYQFTMDSFKKILRGPNKIPIAIILTYSLLWTALLCLSFYFSVKMLNINILIPNALFIYAIGYLAGFLSFIPGGLGIREVTLVFLMTKINISYQGAMLISLLHRLLSTIDFFVLGLVSLIFWRRRSYIKGI